MDRRQFILAASGTLALAGCTEETERQEGSGGSGGGDSGQGGSSGDGGGGSESQDRVEILDHSFYQDDFSSGVRGTLENISDETLSYVQVNVYFLDADETRIGEGLDNASDLQAGRKWQFDAMFLGDNEEAIDSYEISAEVTNF